MRAVKKVLPFVFVILLDFYALPLLIHDTGSAMVLLLVLMPLVCFIVSSVYGARNGFHFLFAFLAAALFVPSIFIFYNSSAWVYCVAYGVITLLGNAAGMLFGKKK